MHFKYILLVSSLLFVAASAITCGSKECPVGDACCSDGIMGMTCFNPNTHDCVEERRLCGEALGVCGSACYDKGFYACYDNSTLCPQGMQLCGTSSTPQCFDPALYSCMRHSGGQDILISKQMSICGGVGYNPGMNDCNDGDIIDIPIQTNCSVGQKQCGSQCYDPQLYDCNSYTLVARPGVCGVGLLWCSSQCYNPSQYNCVNKTLQISDNVTHTCPSGQQSCGTPCYDPSLFQCFSGNVLCSIGMLSCGAACYDNNRYSCDNGNLVGRPGYCAPNLALCGSGCYDSSQFSCVRGILVPISGGSGYCASKKCPSGDECCSDVILGDVCFNPNTHDCVGSRRLCGNGLRACGSICFDSGLYACVADNVITEKIRLCPSNFNVCGNSQCYDPTKYDCVGDSQALCPLGSPVCGGICYDQTLYRCVNGALACRNCTGSNNTDSSDDSDDNSTPTPTPTATPTPISTTTRSPTPTPTPIPSTTTTTTTTTTTPTPVVCVQGELICGNTCYTSDTHVCLDGILYLICDDNEESCGSDFCYDPATHNCTDGVVMPRVMCLGNSSICGSVGGPVLCYDPTMYNCVNGTTVAISTCTVDQELCGSTCYDPSLWDCIDLILVETNITACGDDTVTCGSSSRCYDSVLYSCVNDTLTCLNPCGSFCFDPAVSVCVDGSVVGLIGCATNQIRCGPAINGLCYVPSEYTCVNNTLGCHDDKLICGLNLCYNSVNAYCVNGTVFDYEANAGTTFHVNGLLLLLIATVVLLW